LYDKKTFTYGAELEFGDIDRRLVIPAELGKWEYSETDVINTVEPYKNVACDPLGLSPPFGGEVNTMPTKTYEGQVEKVKDIIQFFRDNGNEPTPSSVSHLHVHVHVPGLMEDVDALKRLVMYIRNNQQAVVDNCHQYRDVASMAGVKGVKQYMKLDCGRLMPEYMSRNIIELTSSFEHFIKLHCAGKDGVSMGRPFRYAINTYCLKHTKTIEFRCFRATVKEEEVRDCFRFVEAFIDAALNGGPDVGEILFEGEFKFPPFVWNRDEFLGWQNTKYDKERGKKERSYVQL
jgi:hypothetical protein